MTVIYVDMLTLFSAPSSTHRDTKIDLPSDSSDDDDDLPIHESEILSQSDRPSVLQRLMDKIDHDTFEDVSTLTADVHIHDQVQLGDD